MAENMYNWQFNTIPGNANQGAVLVTRNDITDPPFQQSDFVWKALEDVIGVANCKLEYNEEYNKYTIYKAKGHQDNNGKWTYTWEQFGTWDALTPEASEMLRAMVYVEYRFYQTIESGVSVLQVYGVRKNGTSDELVNIRFSSQESVDEAIEALK